VSGLTLGLGDDLDDVRAQVAAQQAEKAAEEKARQEASRPQVTQVTNETYHIRPYQWVPRLTQRRSLLNEPEAPAPLQLPGIVREGTNWPLVIGGSLAAIAFIALVLKR